MAKPYIYAVISLTSGAIGAAGSYLFTKRYLDAFYADQIDREVGAALEQYERDWTSEKQESALERDLAEEIEASEKKTFYNRIPPEGILTGSERVDIMSEPAKGALTQYQGRYALDKEDTSAVAAEAESEVEEGDVIVRSHSVPFRVSSEEVYQGEDGYEVANLTYYAGDNILATDSDEVVEIDETIGQKNLELRFFTPDDAGALFLYIRNERLKHLYEVHWTDESYAVVVQGEEPEQKSDDE